VIREDWRPVRSSLAHLVDLTSVLEQGSAVRVASASVFDGLAGTDHPAGILAVFPMPVPPTPTAVRLGVLVDQVRDPGNMGTLIRSAAAFGADCLLHTAATVDPYHPKTVRAAMGAYFAIPVGPFDDAWRSLAIGPDLQVVVSDGDGTVRPEDVDWSLPSLLAIGNEAIGVSSEIADLADITVAIPMAGSVESLNAGVAGAVLLSEAARQRRSQMP
jgi:TrmH family RNA methyltransferase